MKIKKLGLKIFFVFFLSLFLINLNNVESADATYFDNSTNSTNNTHLTCINLQCVVVNGSGINECYFNSDCYHSVCENSQCAIQEGQGINECYIHDDCTNPVTHQVCENEACVVVNGSGINECSTNHDCFVVDTPIGGSIVTGARSQQRTNSKSDICTHPKFLTEPKNKQYQGIDINGRYIVWSEGFGFNYKVRGYDLGFDQKYKTADDGGFKTLAIVVEPSGNGLYSPPNPRVNEDGLVVFLRTFDSGEMWEDVELVYCDFDDCLGTVTVIKNILVDNFIAFPAPQGQITDYEITNSKIFYTFTDKVNQEVSLIEYDGTEKILYQEDFDTSYHIHDIGELAIAEKSSGSDLVVFSENKINIGLGFSSDIYSLEEGSSPVPVIIEENILDNIDQINVVENGDEYFVFYSKVGIGGVHKRIYYQELDSLGFPIGSGIELEGELELDQSHPVAFNSDDGSVFLNYFQGNIYGEFKDIILRKYDENTGEFLNYGDLSLPYFYLPLGDYKTSNENYYVSSVYHENNYYKQGLSITSCDL